MALETTINKETFIGDGAAVEFRIKFPVLNAAHIHCYLSDDAGKETELPANAFTVLDINGSNPRVRLNSPLNNGEKLTVVRIVPLDQPYTFAEGGKYSGENVTGAYDRMEMQIQQLAEQIGRAVLMGITSPSNPLSIDELYKMVQQFSAESAQHADDALRSSIESCQCAGESVESIELIRHLVETLPQFASNVQCYFGFRMDGVNLIIDKTESGDSIRAEDYDCVLVLPAETSFTVEGERLVISLPFSPVGGYI